MNNKGEQRNKVWYFLCSVALEFTVRICMLECMVFANGSFKAVKAIFKKKYLAEVVVFDT